MGDIVGNESDRHIRYKQKVANILRSKGYQVRGDQDDEFAIIRPEYPYAYFVDLCASNGQRDIVVEIDGYRGHKSRRNILKDAHRFEAIKELIAGVECFRFSFWQLKNCPDELIAEELRLNER